MDYIYIDIKYIYIYIWKCIIYTYIYPLPPDSHPQNCGLQQGLLLSRQAVPNPARGGAPYHYTDLDRGATLQLYGRRVTLADCDDTTVVRGGRGVCDDTTVVGGVCVMTPLW